MNSKIFLAGVLFLIIGTGSYFFYDYKIRPELESGKIYREAVAVAMRADKASYNRAIDMHVKLMAVYPDTSYAFKSYISISELYEKLGLFRLADINYNYLIKTYPGKVKGDLRRDILARIAVLKLRQNRTAEGLSQLYSIINTTEQKDLRARIYSEIGYDFLRKSTLDKALDSFNLALYENTNNEEAVLGKARAYVRLGRFEEAFGMYDQFLHYSGEFSPYASDVRKAYLSQLYDTALSSFRSGKYGSSAALFVKLINTFPKSSQSENALYWAGECHYMMKNYKTAVSYFSKALNNTFYHKDEDALIKIGHSHFSIREYVAASKDYQRYIETYPRGRHLNTALKWKKQALEEISRKESVNKMDIDSEVIPQSGKSNGNDSVKDEEIVYSDESDMVYDEDSADESEVQDLDDVTEL